MSMRIKRIDYDRFWLAENQPEWARCRLSSPYRDDLECCLLEACPSDDSVLTSEEEWRDTLPRLIESVRVSYSACVMWASGELRPNHLLHAFRYIADDHGPHRFHIPEAHINVSKGYITSWVSFEFNPRTLRYLLADEYLDVDYVRLSTLFLNSYDVDGLMREPYWRFGIDRLVRNDGLLLSPTIPYFGGCYLTGRKEAVSNALGQLNMARESPG